MRNLIEKFIERVPSLMIHSTPGIEMAIDQTMPSCSQDWAKKGEMLKLTVELGNQWKDQGFHEWDLEGPPSLNLSSCYGSTFVSLVS
jgi:hypothetical protein